MKKNIEKLINPDAIIGIKDLFPNIFTNTRYGFDIVIGNPPYINIEKIPKNDKIYYKKHYKFAHMKYDIYVLFFEVALNLLKENGILSYITSNKYFIQDYGQKIRYHLAFNTKINTLVNFNFDVFSFASVNTAIIILSKDKYINNSKINLSNISKDQGLLNLKNVKYLAYPQKTFQVTNKNKFNISLTKRKIILLKEIKVNTFKIKHICAVNYGLRPGGKNGRKNENFIYKNQNTFSSLIPYFEGKNMGDWVIKSHKYIDYSTHAQSLMYNQMFPALFNNDRLFGIRTLSDISKLRFNFSNILQICNDSCVILTLWNVVKTHFPHTSTSAKRLVKNSNLIGYSGLYNTKMLQGILNSRLIKFYVNELIYDGVHFYPADMASLPIKQLNSSNNHIFKLIEDVVNTIHNNIHNSNLVTKLTKWLDFLVIVLYFPKLQGVLSIALISLFNTTLSDVSIQSNIDKLDNSINVIISKSSFKNIYAQFPN